jgi:hypothetical protein
MGPSPQQEWLLGNHFIIPDKLDPVQPRFGKSAVLNPKRNSNQIERIRGWRQSACPRLKNPEVCIRLLNLQPDARMSAVFGQLGKNTKFPHLQRKRRIFLRTDGADQMDQRDTAGIVRLGSNILANDQVTDDRRNSGH